MFPYRRILLLPVFFATFSCATALTGTRETINVESMPSGADATLVCGGARAGSGVTPTAITIRRNAGDCTLKVSKAGYADETKLIEQGVNPAYWFNAVASLATPIVVLKSSVVKARAIMVGGVSGWLIHYGTGAIHKHRPGAVHVTLHPKE